MKRKILSVWISMPKWVELLNWHKIKCTFNEIVEWGTMVLLSSVLVYCVGRIFNIF